MQFKDNVKVEVNNNLAVITLCRPEKKNAINSTMYENITIALDKLSENKEVAITVITGTGDYYCSGTDLQDGLSNTLGSIDEAIKQASCRLRKFVEAFINHKKILVAVVNGPALGIAVTTLALCDIVYSVDTATFQTPFARLGMTPEGCSSYTFPLILGSARANEMLLFNRKLTAKEALEGGLISRLYTKEELSTVLWPQLRKNAVELPLKSLIYTKKMIRDFDRTQLHEANQQECQRLEERWKSEDCMNAIMSFMQRRSKI